MTANERLVSIFCAGREFLAKVRMKTYPEDEERATIADGLDIFSVPEVPRFEEKTCFVQAFLGLTGPTIDKQGGFILGAFLKDAATGESLGYVHRSQIKRPVDLPALHAEMLRLERAGRIDDDLRILAVRRDAPALEAAPPDFLAIAEELELLGIPVNRRIPGLRGPRYVAPLHPTIQ